MANERSLQRLPAELQFHIMDELDYRSILALQQTNRFFNELPYHCDDQRKSDLVFGAEPCDRHKFNHHVKFFGCYKCFRILPRSHFGKRQVRGKRSKYGSERCSRFCLECADKYQLLYRGDTSNKVNTVNEGYTPRIKCKVCDEWKEPQFCRRCRVCEPCHFFGVVGKLGNTYYARIVVITSPNTRNGRGLWSPGNRRILPLLRLNAFTPVECILYEENMSYESRA